MADSNQTIKIDTVLLRSAVSQIRSSNEIMLKKAESIVSTVDGLEDDWDSDVYRDFKTRVKKSGEVYKQYYAIIENAALLLEGAANAYEKLETSLTKALD